MTETFDYDRCDAIKQRIEKSTARWGCKVIVASSNYDFSVDIFVLRPDGGKAGWTAGLINPPRPLETEGWQPETRELEPAIEAAIDFARPA